MIIAKQVNKTNQILSVGWSLSIGKIREKLWTNQQSSLKGYVKCALQIEINRINIVWTFFFTFYVKKSLKSPEDKVEWKQKYLNWNIC